MLAIRRFSTLTYYLPSNFRFLATKQGRSRGGGAQTALAEDAPLPKYIMHNGRSAQVDLDKVIADMNVPFERLQAEIAKMRVGKASTAFVEDIRVKINDCTVVPLDKLGSFLGRDANTLILNLFDSQHGKAVLAALQSANLNLAISLEDNRVIIGVPKTTREMRERLVKSMKEQAEVCKRNIRDLRTSILNMAKNTIKDKDECHLNSMAVDKACGSLLDRINGLLIAKQKDLLS